MSSRTDPSSPSALAAPWQDDWRLLVESVKDYAIFALSPEGYVVSWNAGAERIKGYAAPEIIGRHFSAFYLPEDIAAKKPERELLVAAETGRVEDEGWRLRKDGTRFWANVVVTALRDASGTLRGFAKVTRDLSERREAQERLRLSEERLRLLIESASDYAIYMLDPEGNVATWNLGAERMKGYRASEIIGQHFSRFFPAEDIERGKPARELEIARAQGRFEDEGWRVRKGGERFWANVVVNRVHAPDGTLLGFAKITRDLSARRQAEETERKFAAAEEAGRAKDEFLATVSHELRTPLNAIVGWSSLLQSKVKDPMLAKGIEAIHRNAEAQARIIEDLLDVSRIVAGKFSLELKPADLVAILTEAIEVIRPAAAAKGVTIDFRATAVGLLVGDPLRLRQVAWNLLSNAVKFSDGNDVVNVRIEQVDSKLALTIVDHGRGIEPELLPRIFERFTQADGSTTRRFGGLGLGLAIVSHIVEAHGGRVHAESAGKGQGALFRVTLPVRAVAPVVSDEASSPRQAQAALEQPLLGGLRVLVVDDDDDALRLLEDLLAGAGALVETASSAALGIAKLSKFQPDVLVSDIAMPGEDGYSLVRKVRALEPEQSGLIPALALTAYTREEDRKRAIDAGFNAHLSKPVNALDLLASIAQLGNARR